MTMLDPWEDAAVLAERLSDPQTRLVLVVAAEAWCGKCRTLKPAFEAWAADAPPSDIPLWLDLDEHGPLLGDYLPEDLPEILVYQDGQLIGRTFYRADAGPLADQIAGALPAGDDPGLLRQLLRQDWAACA